MVLLIGITPILITTLFDTPTGASGGAEENSRWRVDTVDSDGNVGAFSSITLDSNGYPHLAYLGNSNLKYARWSGNDWHFENVDSEGGSYPSINLDSNGFPHISYQANGNLKYARWSGSDWYIWTVDSDGNTGMFTSMRVE